MATLEELEKEQARRANAAAAPPTDAVDTAQDYGRAIYKGVTGLADIPSMGSKAQNWVLDKAIKLSDSTFEGTIFDGRDNYFSRGLRALQKPVKYLSELPAPSQVGADVLPELYDYETKKEGEFFLPEVAEYGVGGLRKIVQHGAKILPDIAAMGGAGLGQAVDIATDGEYSQAIGGLVGAITGGGISGFKQAKKNLLPQQRVNAYIRETLKDKTPSEIEDILAKLRAGVDSGEIGTVTDLTGDTAIASMERFLQLKATPKITDELAATSQARKDQIVEGIGDTVHSGEHSPDIIPIKATAQDVVKQKLADIDTTAQNSIAGAEAIEAEGVSQLTKAVAKAQADAEVGGLAATQAETALTGEAPLPSKASTQLHTTVQKGKDVLDEEAKALWKAFDEGPLVPTEEMSATLQRYLDDTIGNAETAPKAQDFVKKFSRTLAHIKKLPTSAQPEDLSYIISDVKALLQNAKNSGDFGVLEKDLAGMNKLLDDFLADPTNSAAYSSARAKTREMYEKFEVAKTKKSPETYFTPTELTGQKGAETARRIQATEDPAVIGDFEELILSMAKKDGVSPKFLADHADLLDAMPKLRGRLNEVVGAQGKASVLTQAVAQAEGASTQGAKVLKQARDVEVAKAKSKQTGRQTKLTGSIISKFAQNAQKTVKELLKRPEDVADFARLNKQLIKAGKGGEFKALLREELIGILSPKKVGEHSLPPTSIDAFATLRPQLEAAGIITSDEASKIAKLLDRTKVQKVKKDAPISEPYKITNEAANLQASVASAAILQSLGSRQSLMVGGALRRLLRGVLVKGEHNPSPEVLDSLSKTLQSSEKFIKAVESKDAKAVSEFMYAELVALSNMGRPDPEDKEE